MFTLIDVGSMGGIETEWKDVEEEIKVVGFEPDEREFAQLLLLIAINIKVNGKITIGIRIFVPIKVRIDG